MAKKQPFTLASWVKNLLGGNPPEKIVPMEEALSNELMKDEEFSTEMLLYQIREGRPTYQALQHVIRRFGVNNFAHKNCIDKSEVTNFLKSETELATNTITQYLQYFNCELEGQKVVRCKSKPKYKYIDRLHQMLS